MLQDSLQMLDGTEAAQLETEKPTQTSILATHPSEFHTMEASTLPHSQALPKEINVYSCYLMVPFYVL